MHDKWKQTVAAEQEDMLKRVARAGRGQSDPDRNTLDLRVAFHSVRDRNDPEQDIRSACECDQAGPRPTAKSRRLRPVIRRSRASRRS